MCPHELDSSVRLEGWGPGCEVRREEGGRWRLTHGRRQLRWWQLVYSLQETRDVQVVSNTSTQYHRINMRTGCNTSHPVHTILYHHLDPYLHFLVT